MEKWITRSVALICAVGSTALFWTFGIFVAVPWRENRILSLNQVELQLIGIPLIAGVAVAWGALHLLAVAEGGSRLYRASRIVLLLVSLLAICGGGMWSMERIG